MIRIFAIATALLLAFVSSNGRAQAPAGPGESQAPATTPAQVPVGVEVTAMDSATTPIGAFMDDPHTDIGKAGDTEEISMLFNFYRDAALQKTASACRLLEPAAQRQLVRSMRDTIGTATCRTAIVAMSPFARSVVLADVTVLIEDVTDRELSGGATIHSAAGGSVRLKLSVTNGHWRISGFRHNARTKH